MAFKRPGVRLPSAPQKHILSGTGIAKAMPVLLFLAECEALERLFRETCQWAGMLWQPEDIFGYLHRFEFETRERQLMLGV